MTLKNFSASQVATFQDCRRKWYFEKVKGFRKSPSDKMRLGTAIHAGLEQFVETGSFDEVQVVDDKEFNVKYYVEAAIQHIPEGPHQVEQKINLATDTGIPWLGFVDLTTPGQISDYKTTGNMRYAKTPRELRDNVQMMSYAKWYLDTYPDEDTVKVCHIYVETKNKRKIGTKKVLAEVTRSHVLGYWEAVQSVLGDMIETSKAADFNDVPASPKACGKYGGCAFQDKCQISLIEEIGGRKPKKTLASMKKKK